MHPFSQGGGEGEGEHEGGQRGGEAWSLSSPDHRHLRPSWQECTQPLWEEREGEERRRRKQADIKRESKKGKKRASEGK